MEWVFGSLFGWLFGWLFGRGEFAKDSVRFRTAGFRRTFHGSGWFNMFSRLSVDCMVGELNGCVEFLTDWSNR